MLLKQRWCLCRWHDAVTFYFTCTGCRKSPLGPSVLSHFTLYCHLFCLYCDVPSLFAWKCALKFYSSSHFLVSTSDFSLRCVRRSVTRVGTLVSVFVHTLLFSPEPPCCWRLCYAIFTRWMFYFTVTLNSSHSPNTLLQSPDLRHDDGQYEQGWGFRL